MRPSSATCGRSAPVALAARCGCEGRVAFEVEARAIGGLARIGRRRAPKKAKRLERGAAKSFQRVSKFAAKAAKRRRHALSAECASALEAAVAEGVRLGDG
jgi:hypothetical protein